MRTGSHRQIVGAAAVLAVLGSAYAFAQPGAFPSRPVRLIVPYPHGGLAHPDVKQRLLEFGADAVASTPAEFGVFLRAEIAKWSKVVREANIQPE